MKYRMTGETSYSLYILLCVLLLLAIYAFISALQRKPIEYRERKEDEIPLPPPPLGKYETWPASLTVPRLGLFLAFMLMSLEILFHYRYYFAAGLFIVGEFSVFVFYLRSLDSKQLRAKTLSISESEVRIEFGDEAGTSPKIFRLDELKSYALFFENKYVGYGERAPRRKTQLGIGIFDESDQLMFLIPVYMKNYGVLETWIKSSLPLRHRSPLPEWTS